MIQTIIDAEREGSDEARDLKLLNVLMKCIEEAIEEGNLFDDDEDDDNEWDYDNHDRVCLCDPSDFNARTCCCNYLGLSCNGKVDQMDTTGGSILENLPIAKPLVIKFKYFRQLKSGVKTISCT